MAPISVNYDELAPTYNRRFAEESQLGVSSSLVALARETQAQRILEVGCGTGHWLAGIQECLLPPASIFGVDSSYGMLLEGKKAGLHLHFVRGKAEALPFQESIFDMVYCVNAIHHFQDAHTFISEAERILAPGGRLAVIGMPPHRHKADWFVYRYFDGAFETDIARFPTWEQVGEWMEQNNLVKIEIRTVETLEKIYPGRKVLHDPFLDKTFCSQLAMLSEEKYRAGLENIQREIDAAEARGEVVYFPSRVVFDMVCGQKPGI